MTEPTDVHRQTGAGEAREKSDSSPGDPQSRVDTHVEVIVDCADGQRFEFIGYLEYSNVNEELMTHSVAIGPGGVLQVAYQHILPNGAVKLNVARAFSSNYWTNVSGPHREWMTDAEFHSYKENTNVPT